MFNLDIGCGQLKKAGFLGVDIVKGENIDYVLDACDLTFKDKSVDEVYSRRCIQHVKKDWKALSEISRVLKPNGKLTLIVSSWYGWLFYKLKLSQSHGKYDVFHFYTDKRLRQLLEKADFTIESLRHIPSERKIGYDIEVVCIKK